MRVEPPSVRPEQAAVAHIAHRTHHGRPRCSSSPRGAWLRTQDTSSQRARHHTTTDVRGDKHVAREACPGAARVTVTTARARLSRITYFRSKTQRHDRPVRAPHRKEISLFWN